jgi:hypothetical protein
MRCLVSSCIYRLLTRAAQQRPLSHNRHGVVLGILILATFALAQSPADLFSKAPPPIDEALRDRVIGFFKAQSDGMFRQADQYVAEDSKDVFIESDKHRCIDFEIARINYTDQFTKAQVLVQCRKQMMMVPVGVQKILMPVSSLWKIENGKWWWHVVPKSGEQTPFGRMKGGENPADATLPGMMKGPDPTAIAKLITIDRQQLTMPLTRKTSQVVTVTNGMPGQALVEVEPINYDGLVAKVEPANLKPGESAKITITFTPSFNKPPAKGLDVRVRVQPAGRVFPVHVLISDQVAPD